MCKCHLYISLDEVKVAIKAKGLSIRIDLLFQRAVLVRSRPQDFLASMQIHASLQGSPTLSLLSSFGVDLCGLSPDSLTGIGEGKMHADDESGFP